MLHPCDAELTRIQESKESGLKMDAHLSDVYVNLSATTVKVFRDVVDIIQEDGKQVTMVSTYFRISWALVGF